MSQDTDDRARKERESLQREMDLMNRDRGANAAATQSAWRRMLIVLAVLAVGVLLWRMGGG
jgi:hypothetical protein